MNINFKDFFTMVAFSSFFATCPSFADEGSVKLLLSQKYKALPANIVVRKLNVGGLYEVNLLGQEAYTNEKVDFLLVGGSLIDANSLTDVTAQRHPQFLRDFFSALPLSAAIKSVYGKGERVLVSFEDPDCPLCKEQHAEWAKNPSVVNATIYSFMFPLSIHPDAKRKAEFIWCQSDPSLLWSSWMAAGKGVPVDKDGRLVTSSPSCPEGVKKVAQSEGLARALGYHETPRFIFANGMGASGVLTVSQFSAALSEVATTMGAKVLPLAPAASATATTSGAKFEKKK